MLKVLQWHWVDTTEWAMQFLRQQKLNWQDFRWAIHTISIFPNFGLPPTAQVVLKSILNSKIQILSYGSQEVEQEAISATAAITEETSGISAAYTVGAASVRFHRSEADNAAHVSGADDEHMELGVVLAF